jgi:transposase
VALCRQPGASVSRLARECGVNAKQVSRWLREHGYGGRARKTAASMAPAPAAFVAVAVRPASPVATRSGDDIAAVMDVQARLPNGVAIDHRGVELRNVDEVIEALVSAAVFRFDEELKVYLHSEPVDFRLSINGLAVLVEQALGLDPFASCAYVFSNRRRDRVKIRG